MDELNRIVIQLPWPDTSLMPNRKNGRHWGSTHAAKRKAFNDAFLATKAEVSGKGILITGRVPVSITFVAPDKRNRDLDNLLACVKQHLDGIALALGIDDKMFRPFVLDSAIDVNREGFLIVEIG